MQTRTDCAALEKMLQGTEKLCKTVENTLGPLGRNLILDQKDDVPRVTGSAAEIVKQIELEDELENLGVQMFCKAGEKAAARAGDGVGRTILLAQEIARGGLRLLASGANPIALRKGISQAAAIACEDLKKYIRPMTKEQIRQVGTIAGGSDEVGSLVAQAFEEAGMDGVVSVIDSQLPETELIHASGAYFAYGLLSGSFATERNGTALLWNPCILLLNIKVSHIREILPILEEAVQRKEALLIVVREMEQEVLHVLTQNAAKGIIKAAVVEGPGHGETRQRNMQALAAITGAVLIDEDSRWRLEHAGLELCGRAKKVTAGRRETLIEGAAEMAGSRAQCFYRYVKQMLKEETRDFEVEKLQETLAMLQGCMETIQVGGTTEMEMFEAKYRFDSAVQSVYAARRSGVVPGGGKALLLTVPAVDDFMKDLEGDVKAGAGLVRAALLAPAGCIGKNAGFDSSVVMDILRNSDEETGFDCLSGKMVNLWDYGIIDTAEAVLASLLNAAGIASVMLTSGAAVTSSKKPQKV